MSIQPPQIHNEAIYPTGALEVDTDRINCQNALSWSGYSVGEGGKCAIVRRGDHLIAAFFGTNAEKHARLFVDSKNAITDRNQEHLGDA